jgi:hypothetical protein
MKKKILIIALVLYRLTSFGQVINLGTAANFILFTSAGAVDNTGSSTLTGDIGSDLGDISGFGEATVNGSFYNADSVTALAKVDLSSAYSQLISVPPTETSHPPAFGGGETLTAGVYTIAGAGSLGGNLTLDGLGDINSLFIFRFGGAFNTGASSSVILVDGVSCCNIFWISEGAVAMAASTTMKGTIIANNGAISMAVTGDLEGRMLSTAGAVAFGPATAYICEPSPLPVDLVSFVGHGQKFDKVKLEWVTASEDQNAYFLVERSADGRSFEEIGQVEGNGNSSATEYYFFKDEHSLRGENYYRLKQTNLDNTYKYSQVILVENKIDKSTALTLAPSVIINEVTLIFNELPKANKFIEVFDQNGVNIIKTSLAEGEYTLDLDLSDYAPGMYFIRVPIGREFVVKKFIKVTD